MTSRPCVCGVVTSDPGNYTGVVWSEALWVEGGCGRWVEGGRLVTGHPGSAAVQGARWGAKPRQGRAATPKRQNCGRLNAKQSSSRLSSYKLQQRKLMEKGIFKI